MHNKEDAAKAAHLGMKDIKSDQCPEQPEHAQEDAPQRKNGEKVEASISGVIARLVLLKGQLCL